MEREKTCFSNKNIEVEINRTLHMAYDVQVCEFVLFSICSFNSLGAFSVVFHLLRKVNGSEEIDEKEGK